MALNTWWTADRRQRYWMEITHRPDIGADLHAPKLDDGQWSYDLVSQVQPGDRVLHWSGTKRALVGWSEVAGPATTVPEYTWQPRGTSGRALPGPRTTKGWIAPLAGLRLFEQSPTLPSLLPLLDRIMSLCADLERAHGRPAYFPFYRYADTQVRTQQAYFVKFPGELFSIIPGIASAELRDFADTPDSDIPEDFQPAKKRAPHGRTTRPQDPELRKVVERRALDVARAYYESIGGVDLEELGKPYDISVLVDGIERHCEVKGSTMLIDTVELTINEVSHSRDCYNSDLVVVDGIQVTRDKSTGELVASGGTRRVWTNWTADNEALVARRFAYSLPPT